ncbi:hypothetical protein MPTK1_8g03750 [Marchantia polymorpha subsp. ruderalis]|uniref:GDSL esterase/lipase n=1 Tax=Marchantia polymorpha TaxID=3197 RepID=A0A2R6XJF0_MARPO|nr:hypothetical protein MARPO_0012s0165 [Marchantia polymorpha]BBN18591.1 hypothetical protein Mp_8g03750 [Marchantia polymorpha subsp. ruderalis]|eukprot:PTQ46238.1 hypothetical protein MARPO_0012s0165 [Marchantia polymorpha]
MDSCCSRRRRRSVLCVLLVLCCSGSSGTLRVTAQNPEAAPPASFVFGDSLVDSGNNNYIASLARANYASNGIDFEGGQATGRFCNGRHVPDIIGQSLGLPFAPAYLNPATKGTAILKGVNYASGGAGILDDTGFTFIEVITMDKQLTYFENTKSQIVNLIGPAATDELITNALFSVTMGSNDYLNNYFLPASQRAKNFTPKQYQDIVINKYRGQLQKLYDLGARRIVVASVGPLGCIPYQLTVRLRQNGQCDPENSLIINFNTALKGLVQELNSKIGKPHFILVNAYDKVIDLVTNPGSYGFETGSKACCGIGGQYNGLLPCVPTVPICQDRTKNVFWDPYHPTDAANQVLAKQFLDGNDAYPFNIRQLLSYQF